MATLEPTGDLPRFGPDATINDGTGQRTATRFIIHRLEGNPYQYAHLKLIGRATPKTPTLQTTPQGRWQPSPEKTLHLSNVVSQRHSQRINNPANIKHSTHQPNSKKHHQQPHQYPKRHIPHLVPVAAARLAHKLLVVIDIRKRNVLRHRLPQKLAQRAPALGDLILEQPVPRHEAANLLTVTPEDLLPPAGKVPLEKGVKQLPQQGVVHAGRPVHARQVAELGVRGAPVDRLEGRGVPGVDVAGGQDDLGLGVRGDEVGGKGGGGPAAHGLAVAEEAVPVAAGEGPARRAVVLGAEGVCPEQRVGGVLEAARHVVCVEVAEALHGGAESCLLLVSEGARGSVSCLHAVPVRSSPRMRTFMGTVRTHLLRLMSVSGVKMSVKGLGLYFEE